MGLSVSVFISMFNFLTYYMNIILTKKRAISTILTTVIILVASVVLGAGVVLYGTSLFQNSTLAEQITVTGAKIWVDPTAVPDGHAWGAAGLRNSGDTAVSIDKISVRGVAVPFTSWFATVDQAEATVANTQAAFTHSGVAAYVEGNGEMGDTGGVAIVGNCAVLDTADEIVMNFGGADDVCLERLAGPISLDPGDRAIVFFQVINNTLNPIDAGANTAVNIFAGKTGAPLSMTIGTPPP